MTYKNNNLENFFKDGSVLYLWINNEKWKILVKIKYNKKLQFFAINIKLTVTEDFFSQENTLVEKIQVF